MNEEFFKKFSYDLFKFIHIKIFIFLYKKRNNLQYN